LGNDINVSLLGLPAEADWVLFAAYNDKTLMRDALIYTLSRAIGRYASRVVYCEMVLNGEYRGVYILFEKIKRGANRVPISKLEANDITGDAVTGGYIFKIDKTTAGDRWWVSPFPPKDIVQKIQYVYDYPEPDKMVDTQKTYIQHFMTSFETLMNSAGHADTVNGYTKMLDVGSAVDFFLLQELGKNADAYRFSAFLYKDKDSKGGKLNIGPLWDFTLAFGNANYFSAEIPTGWELSYLNSADYFNEYEVPFWWDKLFQDAVFMQTVKTRWVSLRTAQFSQGSIFKYIDSIAVLIDEAQQRNFTTWPILNSYVWPNPYVGGNYTNEISYLKNWILTRIRWMDLALAGYTLGVARTDDELIKSPLILSQNYPNPFNPSTVIPYRLAVNSKIRLKVYDMLGRDVVTLADRFERAGDHSVSFDGSNLPSGVYFYRLQAETHSETKKLTLTK
jgi:hypothetical protein